MNKTVFITGATSGIGRACAEKFAANNYNIIITGRREKLLQEVKLFIEKKFSVTVTTLCFDVQNKEAVFKAVDQLQGDNKQVDILINNAGLALGRDPFDEADITDWETMMNTNVNGLLYMSKALMPHIKKSKGHIINIGSIAGKEVYENGNGYCASKFAVDAISKAMRIDLIKHEIKVTSINPGAVETDFSLVRFKGNEEKAEAAYKNYIPLTAKDIAETIFFCATLPLHVCINDLTITCLQQASATVFFKEQ
ncbi:MAG: SDR family NAD(P)-dependent oxidoreductase [Ferruginibacter sp.]|nr:SDR family NAD(P)-dependent oxidoreductase [Ferruginibacter sp.]